ncbi:MAG: SDR family oxidoreductase [Planctomycetes bacterium]|nr:SDR family oxidoreductase [Planctomycetota bacterium]
MAIRSERHVALVTGGSRGIGEAISRRVAHEGASVLVASRSRGDCERVVESIRASGGTAWPLALDVADPASIAGALEEARKLTGPFGSIDWLVNNAGIAESAPFTDEKREARFERHLATNFHGARRLIEALVPGMEARGYGRVVNVASSAGLRGYAYVSAYCASKFALMGYSLAVADELEGSGVHVNLVCPHYVDSPMLAQSVERLVKKTRIEEAMAREFFRRSNPGGRLVSMDEVAGAVVHLLRGDEHGAVLELDGGAERRLRHPNRASEVAR